MAASQGGAESAPGNRWSTLWTSLVIALIVYVLPLLALGIDELVLKTNWISKQFPAGARTVFFDVYPFLMFLE